MEIRQHQVNNAQIAEVISNDVIIANAEDGINLLGNIYYQGYDKMIVHEKNLAPEFFDLKTKLAGEVLQKFSNYRVQLAIVGDFSKYQSKSLNDFIFESNKQGRVLFVNSSSEAIQQLSLQK